MIILILTPFFLTLILHILVQRVKIIKIFLPNSPQKKLITCSILVDICLITYLITFGDEYQLTTYIFILTILIQYSYFHFFNMSLTARRINIIIEIYNNNANLNYSYTSDIMISNRLKRLVELKQIKIENERVVLISNTFLIIGRILSLIGVLIMGKNRCD